MRLSVILPIYNSAPYLKRCLDSLLASVDDETEIIVIDDGSTDHSPSIIDGYRTECPAMRCFHQANQGVSAARNAALREARGQYIAFVDSDDWMEPGIHRELMDRLERTGADLAVTGFIFEPSGRIPRLKEWKIPDDIRGRTTDGVHRLVMSPLFGMLWNKMFKADIIHERNIRFDEKVLYGEDGIFIMHYLDAVDSISVSDDPMYHYVFRNDSLSHDPRIDRHPHHLESARIRHHYYRKWGFTEESTGWSYRSRILDVISKSVSTYHYGNPGFLSVRRNCRILHSSLRERNLHKFGGWIIKSHRPMRDKIKLILFRMHLHPLLYILHCLFDSRYRNGSPGSVEKRLSQKGNLLEAHRL